MALVSIHRELAALVQQAGRGVLADEREFRAAVDDFIPESLITAGELNLLADAIRLGSHDRVRDAVRHGAAVQRAVADQAARLAELRGTQEQDGARWALEVLAYADGLTDPAAPATVVGEPAAHPASLSAPTSPPAALAPPPPPPTPPMPTRTPAPGAPPTSRPPLPSTLSATRAMPTPPRRRRWPAVVAAVVVLAAAGGAAAYIVTRGDADPDDPGEQSSTSAGPETIPAGTIISADTATIPTPAKPAVMGGRTGGVRVIEYGELPLVGSGDDERAAAEGSRLIGFTLADGPCQARTCAGWQSLGLTVRTQGADVALPAGGPSYVIAVADDAEADLHFAADTFDQHVSLVTGTGGPDNIAVLARTPRVKAVAGGDKARTLHGARYSAITERVDRAELFFFDGTTPAGTGGQAFLRVRALYRLQGGTFEALPVELVNLEKAPGVYYDKRNLGTRKHPDPVFVVPADFTTATFVVGGTYSAPTSDGSRTDVSLDRTTWIVRY